ncbi:MAG: TIGR03663 family protein [Phycisphaerae bacterium]|nr:TIGR03663 family protein [Phycisphaerae bacterium]
MRMTLVRESRRSAILIALVVLVTLVAAAIRLPRLSQRPMHVDEAIHADKFGTLIEQGEYIYDPHEYHGPTLNYFTLISAWLSNQHTYQEIDESTLRVVPVAFGVLLVLLIIGVADGLGWPAAIAAAVLTAISHAMVFYSRYYIQEILLVFFTFCLIACGWRYAGSRRLIWAVLAGVSIAFMHATKETFIIPVAALVLSLMLTLLLNGGGAPAVFASLKKINLRHIWLAVVAAIVVSAVLFSCGFRNPRGIWDSVATFGTYLGRGAGQATAHIHPWYYYLQILGWFKLEGGPLWTEGFILALGVVGLVAALWKRGAGNTSYGFLRFAAFYAVILTVVYSLIPYKTPWCLLGFLHAWILLAGVGVVVILRLVPRGWPRTLVALLLVQGAAHLAWQSASGAFRYYDDHANPYVYAHAGRDVFTVVEKVDEMADLHPDGKGMLIEVICPGADYWPLPWYLRAYTNVGYYSDVDVTTMPAPVIIGRASIEKQILSKIFAPPGQYATFVPLFDAYTELRPTIELSGFVMWDLKDGRLKAYAREEASQ